MSKYVIEIAKDLEQYFKGVMLCGVADGKFCAEPIAVEDLEELNSDYINEHFGELQETAYKKGLHDGESKCGYCNEYQRGLDDAWECARELYLNGACKDLFGEYFNTFIKNHTAQEAIEKLKARKQDDKIKVGDIVERYINGKLDGTGIYMGEDGDYWNCLFWTGSVFGTFAYPKNQFKKTGRHVGITDILKGALE